MVIMPSASILQDPPSKVLKSNASTSDPGRLNSSVFVSVGSEDQKKHSPTHPKLTVVMSAYESRIALLVSYYMMM